MTSNRTKSVVAALMCSLLVGWCGAAFGKTPATKPADPDVARAYCIAQIEWSGGARPDMTALKAWLRGPSVTELARELGVSEQSITLNLSIDEQMGSRAMVTLSVTVSDHNKAAELKLSLIHI